MGTMPIRPKQSKNQKTAQKSASGTKLASAKSMPKHGKSDKSEEGILRKKEDRVKVHATTNPEEVMKVSFDEENIKETLHPEDKDYGLVKIEEPKTPWIPPGGIPGIGPGLDAETLFKKLEEHQATKKHDVGVQPNPHQDYIHHREHDKFMKMRMNHYANEYPGKRPNLDEISDGSDREKQQLANNTNFNKHL